MYTYVDSTTCALISSTKAEENVDVNAVSLSLNKFLFPKEIMTTWSPVESICTSAVTRLVCWFFSQTSDTKPANISTHTHILSQTFCGPSLKNCGMSLCLVQLSVCVCVICGGLVRLVIRFNQSRIFYTQQQFILADITMQPNVPHWPHSTCPRHWWENTECVDVLIHLTKGSSNLHTCFHLLLIQHLPFTVSGCT